MVIGALKSKCILSAAKLELELLLKYIKNRGRYSMDSMEEKGYVVCLLKHTLGDETKKSDNLDVLSGDSKTICLGYFGRVDVAPVYEFKDYMRIASENDAEFIGSRKQLLLYPIKGVLSEKIKQADSQKGKKNCLPFCLSESDDNFGFCCLSVLNISSAVKNRLGIGGLTKIAKCISKELSQFSTALGDSNLPFSIFGLLGTEDLCVLLFSNDFGIICNAVDHLRRLKDKDSQKSIVENSHSVLMVDFNEHSTQLQWGKAEAEIHFSLKTSQGQAYLNKIKKAICENTGRKKIILQGQIGEYDAVIRCPASALGEYLYGSEKLLGYSNTEYSQVAYQSETMLYQRKAMNLKDIEVELQQPENDAPTDADTNALNFAQFKDVVEKALNLIYLNVLEKEKDQQDDILYIRLTLFRLLKDFMKIASIPFNKTFQRDLSLQFRVAVNAIVYASKRYNLAVQRESQAKLIFDESFSSIVNALSNSMQAASQIDKLCFEEQQSHFQNTGAYHKVLMAYYGVIKDVLELIYKIGRCSGNQQAVLVPLISFGQTPIVYSYSFDSFYDKRPAKLICITMPYQALTNVPKYISVLIHELFHYSSPPDRATRNIEAGKCLTAIAFREFLITIASHVEECTSEAGQKTLQQFPAIFKSITDQKFKIIYPNIINSYEKVVIDLPGYTLQQTDQLPSDAFFAALRMGLLPSCSAELAGPVRELFCSAWLEFRQEINEEKDLSKELFNLFALQKNQEEAATYITELYNQLIPDMAGRIETWLKIYQKALSEVPPDLFDIGIVMYDKDNETKAKQYLWQIHRSRSDKLYYKESHALEIEGNTIRFFLVLKYLVSELCNESGNDIGQLLEKWFIKEEEGISTKTKQQNECDLLYQNVWNDYDLSRKERALANDLFRNYVAPIAQQVNALKENSEAEPIMKRLSGFYGRYFHELEKSDTSNRAGILFDLAIDIIECYQSQLPLKDVFESNWEDKDTTTRSEGSTQVFGIQTNHRANYRAVAFKPKDLSWQIVACCNTMVPQGTSSPLWFRGEGDVERPLLPGVMRKNKRSTFSSSGFLSGMRKMMTLAKAKILPQGADFHPAEWLAFLQHYDFKTNLLDWSEDFHSAMFFAIRRWIERPDDRKKDAVIYVLNPILLNLVKNLLECERKKDEGEYVEAFRLVCSYIRDNIYEGDSYPVPLLTKSEEEVYDKDYTCYFDLSRRRSEDDIHFPMAATTPANNDRMKSQAGAFIFYDVQSKPIVNDAGEYTYEGSDNDLDKMQESYFNIFRDRRSETTDIPMPIPFLYRIILKREQAKDFVQYIRAIGIRRYKLCPEVDKLVDDIIGQSFEF